MDMVNTYVIGAEPISKSSKDDHLAGGDVHDSGVLVTREDGISFGLGCVPRHFRQ